MSGNIQSNTPARNPRDIIGLNFYVYTTPIITSLAAGASQTVSIQIEADSDFLIQRTSYSTFQDAAYPNYLANAMQPISVMLVDQGSGRQLMNIATPIDNISGEKGLPFVWPEPKLIGARAVLAVTFANYSSGTTVEYLSMSFIGTKVYRTGV